MTVDMMHGVAHYVTKNYGDYGYTIHEHARGVVRSVFEVIHADGSRFYLLADWHGEVELCDEQGGRKVA